MRKCAFCVILALSLVITACDEILDILFTSVTGITLNKSTLSITSGSKETLIATVEPANATNRAVLWTSSDFSVAAVLDGVVTAVSAGTATITATTLDGGKKATCDVTVTSASITGVTLNKSTLNLLVGDKETLTATVEPAGALIKTIIWKSSNPLVAAVSSTSGEVTAFLPGTATITATTLVGGKTATCTVTVGNTVSGVTLNRSTASLFVGGTETLYAIVSPSNAANKNVTWSSDKTAVATVSASGVVTAVAVGTATITATTADGNKTASCVITVNTNIVSVSGVTLNKSSTSLFVGGTETLTAIVAPSNATNKNVTWNSSNTSVATVSGGVVTAVTAGTATITVTTVDGGKTTTCNVTVNTSTVAVSSISLNKTSAFIIVGNTETLTATISPSNATNQNVTWSSNNTSAATVSGGVVTAVAVGTATITATTVDGSKTATCNVTVNPIPVSGVILNKSTASITVEAPETLYATVEPSNAANKNVTWSSSNTSIVTVSESGEVNAVSVGTATITVTTADGNETASCTVTVDPVNVTFSSVTANGSITQTTTQLTLNFSRPVPGLDADNITFSGVAGVTKGTLDGSGAVYTLPISGFIATGTLSVTVVSPPSYNISGSPKTATIYGMGTATLTITFTQIADNAPSITGPTLYRVSNGGPTSAVLTVDNPGQYDSISWRVQDTTVTGTGSSFTLSASNAAYNYIGEHFVTVSVMKGGVPYNKTVSFKVEY
jgi:uncharacterized protein YjdB